MGDKFRKLREGFLEDLSSKTDNIEEVKKTIGIKPTKKEHQPIQKRPLIFALASLSVIIILLVTINLVNPTAINRNIPTYKGMTAHNEVITPNYKARKNLGGTIEEDIINEIGIVKIPGISCYAKRNESIIITIKLENPKEYEILSFTLNNKKYQISEFLEGSNSEQILVRYNVSDTSGIEEITINAIKYIDNESIKNARFDGNQTIKIGVAYENHPEVINFTTLKEANSVRFSFTVNDKDNLINNQTGLNAYLYDGNNIQKITKLKVGLNEIKYDNLSYGSTYSLIIVGIYDLLDGAGKRGNVLHKETIETNHGYTYDTVSTTTNTISLTLKKDPTFKGNLVKTELYKDGSLIETKLGNNLTINFSNLQSNTEYEIITTYEFNISSSNKETKAISTKVKTTSKEIPTLEISGILPIDNKIIGFLLIKDLENLLKIRSIDLYQNDVKVTSHDVLQQVQQNEDGTTTGEFRFTDIPSGEYKIVIVYEYDLNDGNGPQVIDENSINKNNIITINL